MSIRKRVRWFLIRLRRGDIDPERFERFAVHTVTATFLVVFLVLIGGPVRKAWADINHALSTGLGISPVVGFQISPLRRVW